MILEGIVSTTNDDGTPHLAPMGPVFENGYQSFVLKPFQGSTTLTNLISKRSGVLHFVDDSVLFARSVIHRWDTLPPLRLADIAQAPMLKEFLRAFEFEVSSEDVSNQRAELKCKTVNEHIGRPPRGANRGFNAIIEACILVSRLHICPKEKIGDQWSELERLVDKTGGRSEIEAFRILTEFLNESVSNQVTNLLPMTDGSTDRYIEVVAPARLHFGLLSVGNSLPINFGGCGLMIRDPRTRIRITNFEADDSKGLDPELRKTNRTLNTLFSRDTCEGHRD
ncbi:MAG: DUF447 family protein [Pirellulaceae bacterium]